MKGRQSGMPDGDVWNSFFDAERVIETLFAETGRQSAVMEFGCGYGTFTFPTARHTTGTVSTFDIEPNLVEKLQVRAEKEGISNILAETRDFATDGTGLVPGSQSHAMIYNLLHIDEPDRLLKEAHRVLEPDGRLSVIHWRSDIATPRGPSLDIRPTPEQCIAWIEASGFRDVRAVDLEECCPYHFGIVASCQ